jgi:HesB-like selenoprotein
MAFVKMSELALTEFKKFLEGNNVTSDEIRINLTGNGWSGPVFNLVLDEQKEDDNVEKFGDIKLVVQKSVNDEFGTLVIKCGEENDLGGFSIELENKQEGECASCSSCS